MTYQEITNIPTTNILNYRLSVQLSLSGLSFLVTNLTDKESVFFKEKSFENKLTPEELLLELSDLFKNQEILQENFIEVSVVYATSLYSVVPTPLFDENIASEYLKLNSKILANDYVAYDSLENHNITIVYIPFVNINNYLFDRFGNFKYFHTTTLLVKNILDREKHSKEPQLFINIEKDIFDLIILNKGTLHLCNTYEYKSPEDLIYYVLFCLEQLQLNPDTIPCNLSGEIKKTDTNYLLIYTYIRHISFMNIDSLVEINQKESHEKTTLKLSK